MMNKMGVESKGEINMAENHGGKLYEEITAQMIAQIHDGVLRPGDRLPAERALAEHFGVSRTAIREALRSMEMMGCVESRVGEGTFIKAPSLSNIVDPFSMVMSQNGKLDTDLIEVRLILETEVTAMAAQRRTQAQLEELRQNVEEMRADVENGGNGVASDDRFHAILAEACGNEAMSVMLNMCAGLLSKTRPITQSIKGVPKIALKDHAAICAAVEAQDERLARKLMRTHLNRAMRYLNKANR